MKKVVRFSVFETNSSSSHSFTVGPLIIAEGFEQKACYLLGSLFAWVEMDMEETEIFKLIQRLKPDFEYDPNIFDNRAEDFDCALNNDFLYKRFRPSYSFPNDKLEATIIACSDWKINENVKEYLRDDSVIYSDGFGR